MKSLHITFFILTLLLAPYWLFALLSLALLRKCVSVWLVNVHGSKFRGFLEGQDVLWAIGDDRAQGIVNVMAYISVERGVYEALKTAEGILAGLRERFQEVLMSEKAQRFAKLFYQRKFKFGYYFWLQEDPGSIDKYIRYLTFAKEGEFVTVEELRKTISAISNTDLPDNNTRNWEFLVGSKPIEGLYYVKFPVVFRFTHSLGDGVALMRMFLELLVDSPKTIDTIWATYGDPKPYANMSIPLMLLHLAVIYARKVVFALEKICLLVFFVPFKLADIAFMKKADKNCLHPKRLTGEKVVYWIHESDVKTPLLEVIKGLRQKFPDTRFNEIVEVLLSRGLEAYYKTKAQKAPESVQIMVPERLGDEDLNLDLKNQSSAGILKLPIEDPLIVSDLSKTARFASLLYRVKQAAVPLAEDYEHLVVKWILSWMPSFFPRPLAVRWFSCPHSTIAISVLPGPNRKFKLCGHDLQDVTFWVPNIGGVAVGVSFLSYDNKLQMGIYADRAAIKSEADAALILKGIVKEIRQLKEAFDIKTSTSDS